MLAVPAGLKSYFWVLRGLTASIKQRHCSLNALPLPSRRSVAPRNLETWVPGLKGACRFGRILIYKPVQVCGAARHDVTAVHCRVMGGESLARLNSGLWCRVMMMDVPESRLLECI